MARQLCTIVRRLVPSGETGQRAAKSAVWLFGQNAVDRVLPLVLLVILARLVGPLELGLVGIALVSMRTMRSLTEAGLNEALVQRVEDNVGRYLNTVLAMEVARGVLIFGVLFLAAPFIGRLFDAPAATPLIQVLVLPAWLELVVMMLVGGVVYTAVVLVLDVRTDRGIRHHFSTLLGSVVG